MTRTEPQSQAKTLLTFYAVLNRHEHGYLLKSLINPLIRTSYVKREIEQFKLNSSTFLEDRKYVVTTYNGNVVNPPMTIKILSRQESKQSTHIEFMYGSKILRKKIGRTLFGNEFVRFHKKHVVSNRFTKKVLVTR